MLPRRVAQFSLARTSRVVWTVCSIFIVESLVFGLSGLPAFLFWTWALSWATPPWPLVRPLVLAISLVPAYLVFATTLVVLSAASTRGVRMEDRAGVARGGWPTSSGDCSTGRAT